MEKEIDSKKELKGKYVKITYNASLNEITRDEGKIYDVTRDFVIIEVRNDKLKYISLNKIIRMEEI